MDLVSRVRSLSTSSPFPAPLTVDFGSDGLARSKQTDAIEPFKHYFRFDINQLYVANRQEYWANFDPLLYAAIDYQLGKERVVSSMLVGPKAIHGRAISETDGVTLNKTEVAGPIPFNGADVGITIILYKIARHEF